MADCLPPCCWGWWRGEGVRGGEEEEEEEEEGGGSHAGCSSVPAAERSGSSESARAP